MAIPLRVLMVEDQENDAILLLQALRRGGWDVTHHRVETAEAMIAELQGRPWDIIISDYSMPRFSGPAALDVARRHAIDLPFFLVSATVGEETAVQAMKAGADDYLFKGNLKRLAPAVERALREARERCNARRIEQELRQRDIQLADARRLACLGAWHVDLLSGLARCSDEAMQILDCRPGETCTTFDKILACLHPEDRSLLTNPLGSTDLTHFATDCRIVQKDGGIRHAHIRGDIVRNEIGKAIEASGMIQDITERKLAEQQLLKAHDELSAANKTKDHFLAVLSHELRTPLTPVLAVISYWETLNTLPPELMAELGTIRRNVEMEARLIDDLLDLTRIVRNKLELRQEVVDAHVIARDALKLFQGQMAAKQLAVTIDLAAREHHVWADAIRLQQVFMNLLSNSLKFTPPGGSISARTANDEQGRLVVHIRDSGIGIDPEVLPRVFNNFEQGERTVTRKFGGLGLGLAIAKSLIEMHGGTITASSDGPNQGTTLTILLNTVAAMDAVENRANPALPSASPMSDDQPCRILLVEDHVDTRRIMSRLLKNFGCSVATAGSVKEALEAAEGATFDLLVSDIGLPDGTGNDIMMQVKDRHRMKGIAISGFGQEEDLRRSREAGFEMHLTKPVDIKTLESVIHKMATARTEAPAVAGAPSR